MKFSKAMVWFRNDLRLHDNETLTAALASSELIFPVYIFDERHFSSTKFGFPKTGNFRAQFLVQTVAHLRESLQKLGSNLIVRFGKPEEELLVLARDCGANAIFYSREVTDEELAVENAIKQQAKSNHLEIKSYWQSTLFHIDDIPFSISTIPDVFSNFRRQVEKSTTPRLPLNSPCQLNDIPSVLLGEIPSLKSLGLNAFEDDDRKAFNFKGGESEALRHMQEYIWESKSIAHYKETRNMLMGENVSSKFSPWLANGSLSPRRIYADVKLFENEHMANDSTYWIIFELIWRDYFRLISLKYGNEIFKRGGIKQIVKCYPFEESTFMRWAMGETGIPFIDANMRELKATGYMSNRGRQNVASFLVHDLKQDWRAGAEWFESLLIDYDVASNYGNWNYVAGIGNDPRENRYFNVIRQANMYDKEGEYVKHWIKELRQLPTSLVHTPYRISLMEETFYNFKCGKNYHLPIKEL